MKNNEVGRLEGLRRSRNFRNWSDLEYLELLESWAQGAQGPGRREHCGPGHMRAQIVSRDHKLPRINSHGVDGRGSKRPRGIRH